MNPTAADATPPPPPPPPPPPQPPRSSFSCDRHPDDKFNGFCPSCLCERLTVLDKSFNNTPSSSRRPSSATAALKSLFTSSSFKPTIRANSFLPPPPQKPTKPNSFLPELRRTKSFSASKTDVLSLSSRAFEPQRKSCDVRVRNSLWSLFTLDNENKTASKPSPSSQNLHYCNNIKQYESFVANKPVFEVSKEAFKHPENEEEAPPVADGPADEITPAQDGQLQNLGNGIEREANNADLIADEAVNMNNLKPMKDNRDLDTQAKKSSGGGFWAAASVFSKKWHEWRRKQKIKKQNNGENLVTLPVKKRILRKYGETQSEIADYVFGRRSCDTDPRFSLDAGRISFDDPRYSFDEPRASWDRHSIGRSFPRMPSMVSVLEDAPAVRVLRSDMQIPVEGQVMMTTNCVSEFEGVPGGSVQTQDYYLDSSSSSSSRRRKSLDRSSSIRKTAAAVVAEMDEIKAVSNSRVSRANADYFHGAKVLMGERELRDSNSNSLRDDYSETFELCSAFMENGSAMGNGERKELKKSRRWSWRIWGFIHRRSGRNEDEERYNGVNRVDRLFSKSWHELRRDGNDDTVGESTKKVLPSNSSVNWRNSNRNGNSFGSVTKSGVEMKGHGKKRRDEFVQERNWSARYSPNHIDNGLLRFYLTPLRSSRRGGPGKLKSNGSHSIARSVMRLH